MATENQGVRQPDEFSFESYVARQFTLIHERFDNMGLDIEGLEIDEQTLVDVIPKIAQGMSDLHTALTNDEVALNEKVTQLQAKEAEVAADEAALATVRAELATAQGELAKVAAIKTALDPVVAEASKLVPAAPPAEEGGGAPAGGGPLQPPAGAAGSGVGGV